jgi:cytochrome c553
MKKLLTMVVLGAAATAALAQEVKGNGDAAKDKVAMCIGCHGIPGYRASFPEVYEVPMLGGQSAKYIENALKAYQKGDRKHPTMRGIAATLTDQDIADVAAYYSQQKSASQNNTLK